MRLCILIWTALRPKQWTKNLFVFAGLLFSQNIFNPSLLLKGIFAFLIFCLLSGCAYLFNDLADLKQDRCHPVKSKRPLASGRLKVFPAILALIILTPISLGMAYLLNQSFFLVASLYLLLQAAYSLFLKRIVILDVFTIASGFALRVIAGALVIDVRISSWLLVCTILLSLFLGLSKRRHELTERDTGIVNRREVLGEYSPYLLDQMISVVTASTLVAYALYTMSDETIARFGTRDLIFTLPFVLYGIFRYLYLVHQQRLGSNPEDILLTDRPLMISIFLWAISVGIIIYG